MQLLPTTEREDDNFVEREQKGSKEGIVQDRPKNGRSLQSYCKEHLQVWSEHFVNSMLFFWLFTAHEQHGSRAAFGALPSSRRLVHVVCSTPTARTSNVVYMIVLSWSLESIMKKRYMPLCLIHIDASSFQPHVVNPRAVAVLHQIKARIILHKLIRCIFNNGI